MERYRKERYEIIKSFNKYVKITDKWMPNDTVYVTLTLCGGYVKFTVSGGAGYEFERYFNKPNKNMFWKWKHEIYDQIPEVTNMYWFSEHGFH